MATLSGTYYYDKSTGKYYDGSGININPGKAGQDAFNSGAATLVTVNSTQELPWTLRAGDKYVLKTDPNTGNPEFFLQRADGTLEGIVNRETYDKLQSGQLAYERIGDVGSAPVDQGPPPEPYSTDYYSSAPYSPTTTSSTSSPSTSSGTTISQQDYYLKPGETIDQYNARIAALRGETTSGSTTGTTTGSTGLATTSNQTTSAPISQQDYYLRPGETIDQYNARIAALRSGGTTSGTTSNVASTGDPALDATLASLNGLIAQLAARGQVINPNIKIDEATLAKFTKQAEAEINPYYATQLKLARERLLTDAGYSRDEILKNEQDLERQYKTAFRGIGESAADQGFALSGLRQRSESELAQNVNDTIAKGRRDLSFKLGDQAAQFAQQFGGRETPTVNIADMPTVASGELGFNRGGQQRSLYTLDPNIYDSLIGEQQFANRGAVKNRAAELEQAFRSNQALDQQRSLVL